MLVALASTKDTFRVNGNGFSTGYTFNHLRNNWIVGACNAKMAKHANNGKSTLSARPLVLQVGYFK